jgi:catechol 2,3-dioxygenase-like lactoylglutathione lyase family enzyme
MFIRIDHVELAPADMERTIAFYRDVIGFTLTSRHPIGMSPLREIAYMTLADTMLELLGYEQPNTATIDAQQVGYRLLALEVDDMAKTVEELAGNGVPITWGPMSLGASIRAEIRDPDGLGIELRQWLDKASWGK